MSGIFERINLTHKCATIENNDPITDEEFEVLKNCTKIYFGYLFNQPISYRIPEGIKKIKFIGYIYEYETEVDDCRYETRSSFQHNKFNQPFSYLSGCPLPSTLQFIFFGDEFNQPIFNEYGSFLPNSLKKIYFGIKFNQQIANKRGESVLPEMLEEIRFGTEFNQPVENEEKSFLPENLKFIGFGSNFDQKIDKLPGKIENLYFWDGMKMEDYQGYYYSTFNKPINNLPKSLKKLTLSEYFNQPVDNLPLSLEEIIFGGIFNQPVDNLPLSLRKIKFGESFNKPTNNLPNKIKYVSFWDIISINNLPDSIEEIEIENINYYSYWSNFAGEVVNYDKICRIPKCLKILQIGGNKIEITDEMRQMSNEDMLENIVKNIQNILYRWD